ncbi:hypothetical protein ACFLZX_06240 [Nanoarchaeota archaeon]
MEGIKHYTGLVAATYAALTLGCSSMQPIQETCPNPSLDTQVKIEHQELKKEEDKQMTTTDYLEAAAILTGFVGSIIFVGYLSQQ